MIEAIGQLSKQYAKDIGYNGKAVVVIEETYSQHADFLTLSYLIDRLAQGLDVTFLALRQNYAHYIALTKKIGRPIQPFLRSQKLHYFQCFAHGICSELPLTDSSPSVYARPPKTVETMSYKQIQQKITATTLKPGSSLVVDAVSFLEHDPETVYYLFEVAAEAGAELILSGCLPESPVTGLLKNQADVWYKLEEDVGGHGKFRVGTAKSETSILWKWSNGKFELSKFMKL